MAREDGWLAEQLDLHHRGGAFTVRVADTVGAGVAAADHDNVLAGGADPAVAALTGVEVVHRKVDAVEIPARNRQVAGDA